LTLLTKPPLLGIMASHIKDYALTVISAALIYGGIHQVISALRVLIFPIADMIPRLVGALADSEFNHLPSLLSYYNDTSMWFFVTKIVAVAIIVIVAGLFVGLWANSRDQRTPVLNG
jgi:hypothetical protein